MNGAGGIQGAWVGRLEVSAFLPLLTTTGSSPHMNARAGVPIVAQWLTNLTMNLAQWVKDPALP